MSISATNQFYVYVYLDPRKPGKFKYNEYKFDYEPFYVGKGGGNKYRLKHHLNEYNLNHDKNKLKVNKIRKIIKETGEKPITLKFQENLLENIAFNLETKMIKTIGRIDLGTGPLTNLTDGGEGLTGKFGKDNPNFGNKWSNKQKENLSLKKKGKNIGQLNPNAKIYKFTNLKTNQEFIIKGNFRNFCQEHDLTYGTMIDRLYGLTKEYKKFKEWKVENIGT